MSGFSSFLARVGAGRLISLGIVTASLIAFFVYVALRFATPSMALLYANLDRSDSGEIIAKLEALDIPYKLQGDGTTILVPDKQARRLRMQLAEQGLPSGDTVGYELFDDSDALGQTSFVQNINRLRALEGELARTIRAIDAVANARVHLVIPRRELFASSPQEPTASIVVKARGGFNNAQVSAIQHLVAAAVPGLSPGRIAIVSDKGKLLARGVEGEFEGGLVAGMQDNNASFEARLTNRIQMLVGSIVGPENARVQVTASIDLDRMTENSEIFDPNGRVTRSSNLIEQESETSEPIADAVSVGAALPGSEAAAGGGENSERDSRTEETSNYEISRTTRVLVKEAGAIKRLSVAVLVNGGYEQDEEGVRSYVPRSDEEIQQILSLVRTAIGFDEQRGDDVQVVNMRFSEFELPAVEPEETPLLGLEGRDWFQLIETAVLGIVTLLTALFIFRPLINRLLDIPPAAMGGELQPALATGVQDGVPQITGPSDSLEPSDITGVVTSDGTVRSLSTLPEGTAIESMINVAQIEGQVKESSIRKVGEVVDRHPDEAIAIMRSWLHDKP